MTTPVPGWRTNLLTLTVDDADVTPEVSSVAINTRESDADFKSFANGAGGLREYYLTITAVQGGEVWKQVWSHLGETIDVLVRPQGNATASASAPHYSGTVTIAEPDDGALIAGDYDQSSTQRWVVELEWVFDAKPLEVTS